MWHPQPSVLQSTPHTVFGAVRDAGSTDHPIIYSDFSLTGCPQENSCVEFISQEIERERERETSFGSYPDGNEVRKIGK